MFEAYSVLCSAYVLRLFTLSHPVYVYVTLSNHNRKIQPNTPTFQFVNQHEFPNHLGKC